MFYQLHTKMIWKDIFGKYLMNVIKGRITFQRALKFVKESCRIFFPKPQTFYCIKGTKGYPRKYLQRQLYITKIILLCEEVKCCYFIHTGHFNNIQNSSGNRYSS